MAKWLKGTKIKTNLLVEGLYFPALMGYFVFVLPAVFHALGRKGWGLNLRRSLMGFLFHCGIVLPYLLGYASDFLSTSRENCGLLYGIVLSVAELPTIIVTDFTRLPKLIPSLGMSLGMYLFLLGGALYALAATVISSTCSGRQGERSGPPA